MRDLGGVIAPRPSTNLNVPLIDQFDHGNQIYDYMEHW
jgi:hypothetical protein